MVNLHTLALDSHEFFGSLRPNVSYEELLGEFLHLCLFHLEFYDGRDDLIEKAVKTALTNLPSAMKYRLEDDDIKKVRDWIHVALKSPKIGSKFSTYVRNLREWEFLDGEGKVVRIDRINFMTENNVDVIEFKLKEPSDKNIEEGYRQQIRGYVKIVREVFKRETVGTIIYFEDNECFEIQ